MVFFSVCTSVPSHYLLPLPSSIPGTIPETVIVFSSSSRVHIKKLHTFWLDEIVSTYLKYYLLWVYVLNNWFDMILHTNNLAVVSGLTLTIPLCLFFTLVDNNNLFFHYTFSRYKCFIFLFWPRCFELSIFILFLISVFFLWMIFILLIFMIIFI